VSVLFPPRRVAETNADTCDRRLKINFTNLSDDDNARLLKCHREVEEAFEKERWSLVSRSMSREGSETYVVSTAPVIMAIVHFRTLLTCPIFHSRRCFSASSRSSCTRAPTCVLGETSTSVFRRFAARPSDLWSLGSDLRRGQVYGRTSGMKREFGSPHRQDVTCSTCMYLDCRMHHLCKSQPQS